MHDGVLLIHLHRGNRVGRRNTIHWRILGLIHSLERETRDEGAETIGAYNRIVLGILLHHSLRIIGQKLRHYKSDLFEANC